MNIADRSHEDLWDFSSVIRLLDLPDQRKSPRLRCRILSSFRFIGSRHRAPQEGLVVDISESGMRMVVGFPVEVDTLLAVRIDDPTEFDSPLVFASVVRCRPNRGYWELGCSFVDALEQFDA